MLRATVTKKKAAENEGEESIQVRVGIPTWALSPELWFIRCEILDSSMIYRDGKELPHV